MYKVSGELLMSCKKYLEEYLLFLGDMKAAAKTIKEKDRISKKIIKINNQINKLKQYDL